MKPQILKMGEFTQEEAGIRVATEDLERLKKEVMNLLDYAGLVEDDIDSRHTGWYYQFQSAIQRTRKAMNKMKEHEAMMAALQKEGAVKKALQVIARNSSYGAYAHKPLISDELKEATASMLNNTSRDSQ